MKYRIEYRSIIDHDDSNVRHYIPAVLSAI